MRTKLYIKELETEVLRLRKTEAAAKARVDELDRQNERLLQVLMDHGINPPEDLDHGDVEIKDEQQDSHSPWAQVQHLSLQQQADAATPGQRPSAPHYSPHNPQQVAPVQLLPDNGNLSVVPSLFAHPDRLPTQAGLQQQVPPGQPFEFHNSQAEVDFILTYGSSAPLYHSSHVRSHNNF